MPSTYSSNLKLELMGTGDQSGTWGNTTNTNLGTALEQAIVGYGNPNFTSDANLTLTLTDSNASQAARCFVLNVTSSVSLSVTRELVVPTIQKPYIIRNNTTGGQSITVKTSAGSGVTVPNSDYVFVYTDGTNVVSALNHIPSLTLGSPLAVTSGGTSATSASGARTALGAVGLTGDETVAGVKTFSSKPVLPATAPTGNEPVSKTFGDSFYGPSFGLTLSNNTSDATNDIDIAAGARWDVGRTARMLLSAGVTRQLDVAFGSGNGGRFDTAIANGTWHVFLISNGTLVNVGFSQSLNPTGTANYPSGYTLYRRIGIILRESGTIIPFQQTLAEFLRKATVLDVSITNSTTSAVTTTLSVPVGVKVEALMNVACAGDYAGNSGGIYLSSLDVNDEAPSHAAAPQVSAGTVASSSAASGNPVRVRTNTSAQIRRRTSSAASATTRIATLGWIDQEIMEP